MARGSIKLSDLLKSQSNLENLQTGPAQVNRPGQAQATQTEPEKMSLEDFKRITSGILKDNPLSQGQQAATKTIDVNIGTRIFEEFIKQTQKREDLLKDATEEQKDIFKELERTIDKLREAGAAETLALKKAIDDLTKKLAGTKDTEAKKNIQKVVPPEYRAPAYATPKEAAAGPQYEGSKTDSGAEEEAQAQVQPQQAGSPLGLLDILGTALTARSLGNLYKNGKSGPAAGSGKGGRGGPNIQAPGEQVKPKSGIIKDAQGRLRNAKTGKYVKPTALNKARAASKSVMGGASKVLGVGGKILNAGARFAPLAGAAFQGYEEYKQTGDAVRAATVSGTSLVGGAIGGLLLSALGPVGTMAGAYLGSEAGQYVGEFVDNINPFKKEIKDVFTKPVEAAKRGIENSYQSVKQLSSDIADNARKQTDKPPVIVQAPAPQVVTPAPTIYASRADVRPSENSFERHTFRNYA
jgi:hypothetical protein